MINAPLFHGQHLDHFQGAVLGALTNIPLNDRLGLGKVRLIKPTFYFYKHQYHKPFIFQMLVFGCLLQIAAFSIQSLELPFPLFVLSFGLGGIGLAFQVGIHMKERVGNNATPPHFFFCTYSRMRLRTASLRLFKLILNIKWVLYMLLMVQPFPKLFQSLD